MKLLKIFFVLSLLGNFGCGQTGEVVLNSGGRPGSDNSASGNGADPGLGIDTGSGTGPGAGATVPPGPGVVIPPSMKSMRKTVEINSVSKVDALVVIDNSGSMATEQANMASRFSTFIDQLQGLDWQVAVTTTDVRGSSPDAADGRLLPFGGTVKGAILNSNMNREDVKAAFAETIQRSEHGDGNEQAIAATYRAIERSLKARTAANGTSGDHPEFIRDDAALAVIAVTDADETPFKNSRGERVPGLKNKPLKLLDFIEKTWKGSKSFSFHSIIVKEGDGDCLAKDENEDFGRVYSTLSRLTNGIIGSVCEADYGSQLRIIGKKVQDQTKTIHLDCVPAAHPGESQAKISLENSRGLRYPAFRLEKADLIFEDYLPEGKTLVDYVCISTPEPINPGADSSSGPVSRPAQ